MIALWTAWALAADPAWERAACDIPTAAAFTAGATDVEACEAACAVDPACAAYVFISGWDRCSLKRAATPRIALHMVAAQVTDGPDGARIAGEPHRDHDHAGKDLEASPRDLPDAAACAAACDQTAACRGYVYIEGYRSCWLKATDGAVTPKTFTCAPKPAAPPTSGDTSGRP